MENQILNEQNSLIQNNQKDTLEKQNSKDKIDFKIEINQKIKESIRLFNKTSIKKDDFLENKNLQFQQYLKEVGEDL